jgi:hypothetical protein
MSSLNQVNKSYSKTYFMYTLDMFMFHSIEHQVSLSYFIAHLMCNVFPETVGRNMHQVGITCLNKLLLQIKYDEPVSPPGREGGPKQLKQYAKTFYVSLLSPPWVWSLARVGNVVNDEIILKHIHTQDMFDVLTAT